MRKSNGRARSHRKDDVGTKSPQNSPRRQSGSKILKKPRNTRTSKEVDASQEQSTMNEFAAVKVGETQKRKRRSLNNSRNLSTGEIEVKKVKLDQGKANRSLDTINSDLLALTSNLVVNLRRTRSVNKMTSTPTTPSSEATLTFMSPIDKLLIKNGSTSANNTVFDSSLKSSLFSPPRNDSNSELHSTEQTVCDESTPEIRSLKQRKAAKKSKRSLLSDLNINKLRLVTENIESDSQEQNVSASEDVSNENWNNEEADVSQSDVQRNVDSTCIQKCTTSIEKPPTNNCNDLGAETEPLVHVKVERHTELEMMLLPNDKIAAPSPSTLSTDSAKGSSVVNDAEWIYVIGEMYWGQIYTYCYWPCMVCPDPEGKTVTTEGGRDGERNVIVHVRFFADNGRRNWVKQQNLMPYSTIEHYWHKASEVRQLYGRQNPKYKLFCPKRARQKAWSKAVIEANVMVDVPYEERLTKFFDMFQETRTLRAQDHSMTVAAMDFTSDFGSLYDSNDNIYNEAFFSMSMRENSMSPFSPAYSPIKTIHEKRHEHGNAVECITTSTGWMKGEQPMTPTTAHVPTLGVASLQDVKSAEFRKLYVAMRDFVMGDNRDVVLEKSLALAVRNIWSLKQLNTAQVQQQLIENHNSNALGSSMFGNVNVKGSVKRLSNRLRNLGLRQLQRPIKQEIESLVEATPEVRLEEKPKAILSRPIEEVINDMFNLDSKYLFKGLGRDPVCKYCCQPGGNLARCSMRCMSWLHASCIPIGQQEIKKKRSKRRSKVNITNNNISNINNNLNANSGSEPLVTAEVHITAESDMELVVCHECTTNQQPKCTVCNQANSTENELVLCSMVQCFKYFHPSCCRYWPQAKLTISKNKIELFRCPSHVCHTCVSDDPKSKYQNLGNGKITKCVKCPASYHTDSTCIPAGSQILTAAYIICPRHNLSKADLHVNVNWCFVCVGGGQVVCCETCPTAVHATCLNISLEPNEAYICEECESGRMPLYGEIVWAKFNLYRWWPALILPPTEIPQNILRKSHNPSEFVVRFFGTHDHGWISRRRVYLFLEGDCSEPPRTRFNLPKKYLHGVEEAKKIYEMMKLKKQEQYMLGESKSKLHPQPYIRIKANRAVPPVKLHTNIKKVNKCECVPDADNPCGPDSNCLNRVLYHECNPKICPAGVRCQNQMFESRISPRFQVVHMKERGFGLITLDAIEEGSFVIEYVGEIINDEEFKRRMSQKSIDRDNNFYFLSLERDYIIDAGPKGNLARFMNHSCDPNCEAQKWSVNGLDRIGLFAVKNIPENTELTFNYNWDELLGTEKKTCYCGASKCVGQIGAKLKTDKVKEIVDIKPQQKKRSVVAKKSKPLKRLQKNVKGNKNTKPAITIKISKAKPRNTAKSIITLMKKAI